MYPRAPASRLLFVSIDGLAAPYLADPDLDLPHLARLSAAGATVGRVATPLPGVTWPCHTTLVTGVPPGRHGVLGNLVVDRASRTFREHLGDRAYDKDEVVRVPTLYDLAHRAGHVTAAVCWPQTRGARTLDFHVPEALDQPIFDAYATPALWRELRAAGLPVERYGAWSATYALAPMQDRLTTDVTCHVIVRHRPSLVLLHYLALDCYQHDFGAGSPEARWALEYIDAELGRVLGTLARAGLAEQTAVVVASDHGFTNTATRVLPNVWLRQAGLLHGDDMGRPIEGQAVVAANGGVAAVTVLREQDRPELVARLSVELGRLPGVVAVHGPSELPGLGLPDPDGHPHAGDLLLVAAPDAYFDSELSGDAVVRPGRYRATHGHPSGDAWTHTAMIAAGPGVAAGARVARADLAAVGATAAALLGLAFPDAAAPLREILAG